MQFWRFLAAGGVAAIANYSSRFLFSEIVRFEIAVVLAYCVGMATGFILKRTFVFEPSDNTLRGEMGWYVVVNLVALVQTWLVSVYLARWLAPELGDSMAEAVAHAAGVMVPVASSYFGHKTFTFRKASEGNGQ